MFMHPHVLERELGLFESHAPSLRALEEHLESFCAALAVSPVDERDERAATREYVRRLAAAGLLRHLLPASHGGVGEIVEATTTCLIRQWLARHSAALDTAFVMQGLGSYPLVLGGQPALRDEVLPGVLDGTRICAFALTEPDAGSDISAMQTRAEPAPGGVRLRGRKCFISNAGIATSYVLFAREADDKPDGKPRFGAFWFAGDVAGLHVEPMQVIAPHPIGALELDGVFVPDAHRIGREGEGLRIALANLDQFRVSVGAAALGMADRALTIAVDHLKTRVQFGKPLAEQQGLRFALAELATAHVAAQLLVYRAATARDRGATTSDLPAMAKLQATETAQRVIDGALQCLGGRGVLVGEPMERLYREIRALRIYEGTSEIQKLVIARALFAD